MEFRPWLVLSEASQQETQALKIVGGDEGVLGRLKSISPEPKFLPVLALLHREQPDLAQLGKDWREYRSLLDKKKMPPLSVQGSRVVVPPQNQPMTYLQWTEKVHAMGGDMEMAKRRVDIDHSSGKPPIFKNEELEIYETDGPGDCIRYGKGYSFCISQPGNTMWQSYRDTQASTFYFVYDKSRPETDPLHIVVVDMTNRGPILTDARNKTGHVSEYGDNAKSYLDHLYKRGVPHDIFKNRSYTEKEKEESETLGRLNPSLDWFKALSPEHKSKYIGRGYRLSEDQFNYIFDNGMESLVKQYAEMGIRLNGRQADRMLDSKFKSTYLHFRLIANERTHDISPKEYDRLDEKQKGMVSSSSMIRMLVEKGDMEGADRIISSKAGQDGIFASLWASEQVETTDQDGRKKASTFSLYHFPTLIDIAQNFENSQDHESSEKIWSDRLSLLKHYGQRCFSFNDLEFANGIYILHVDGVARFWMTDCDDIISWADGLHDPFFDDCDAPITKEIEDFLWKHVDMDCHAEEMGIGEDEDEDEEEED